jgi:hypothetical protein
VSPLAFCETRTIHANPEKWLQTRFHGDNTSKYAPLLDSEGVWRIHAKKDLFGARRTHHNGSMQRTGVARPKVSLGRHKRTCSVCAHQMREKIEAAFLGWRSPASIAEEFGLRAALERIIEKAGEVDVTASAVVAAVQAYAKINAAGEWIDRTETTSMNDLFEKMSTQELEAYAQTGALPEWFTATVGETENVVPKRIVVDV